MRITQGVERLHAALDYHLTRHNVLVSNLAQLETPGHVPVDLMRGEFDKAMKLELRATSPRHMRSPASRPLGRLVADPAARGGVDGNSVDVDREAVKIATNQVRYDVVAQLATGALSSLSWAVADGRGA